MIVGITAQAREHNAFDREACELLIFSHPQAFYRMLLSNPKLSKALRLHADESHLSYSG